MIIFVRRLRRSVHGLFSSLLPLFRCLMGRVVIRWRCRMMWRSLRALSIWMSVCRGLRLILTSVIFRIWRTVMVTVRLRRRLVGLSVLSWMRIGIWAVIVSLGLASCIMTVSYLRVPMVGSTVIEKGGD